MFNNKLSRRRFLGNFAFTSAPIATGTGSWVIRPDWANAAEGPIKLGIATDLTGPIGYAGNADANVARMVVKEINDADMRVWGVDGRLTLSRLGSQLYLGGSKIEATQATYLAPAIEIMSAGITVTRPSPMVSTV